MGDLCIVSIGVQRYLDHSKALTKFKDVAFGHQICRLGLTEEVDVETLSSLPI